MSDADTNSVRLAPNRTKLNLTILIFQNRFSTILLYPGLICPFCGKSRGQSRGNLTQFAAKSAIRGVCACLSSCGRVRHIAGCKLTPGDGGSRRCWGVAGRHCPLRFFYDFPPRGCQREFTVCPVMLFNRFSSQPL